MNKILIVEDEAIVAEDIASHLEKMGYQVADIVASAEAAIAAATLTQPDLILMDIMLQGQIDGITAAKRIHQILPMPIVYLTAYADEGTLQRAKFSGSFGYILKPFTERELRATIEIALTRYQLEKRVVETLDQVQSNNQRQSHYLSIISHELRNPLAQINTWIQLLQRYNQTWPPEKQQQSLQQIQAIASSMGHLLDDVLILQRTELTQEQNYTPFDLINFCQEIIQTNQFLAKTNYDFHFNYEGDFREIHLDKILLGYILNNLLVNAIKYSPHGGKITLDLLCLEQQACLQITDQGIGISSEDLQQLFQPFYRGSNVGDIPGTGLGLIIVKRAIELLEGSIEVSSQIGVGTEVTVSLPV